MMYFKCNNREEKENISSSAGYEVQEPPRAAVLTHATGESPENFKKYKGLDPTPRDSDSVVYRWVWALVFKN